MSKLKTVKAIAKRFKVTKNGKILKRVAGQGHFNARETGKENRNKRRDLVMADSYAKHISASIVK
ncbi:MAG TPA: 50S ribosomal protein L35 [Candidatus Magasanikbacteria bacterium]|nr:50S ribosomal protein L35 [Candidatus Magasanikbacteria bacterium]